MSASWDEARRCPEHGSPGKEIARIPAGPNGKFITLECERNEVCGSSPWTVQVRADGSIPEPTMERDKQFAPLPGWRKERGRDIMQNLQQELARQSRPSESSPTTEVTNPYS